MCCDICPGYLDCEEKKRLKDECCSQCPEYKYCKSDDASNIDNAEGDIDKDSDVNGDY